ATRFLPPLRAAVAPTFERSLATLDASLVQRLTCRLFVARGLVNLTFEMQLLSTRSPTSYRECARCALYRMPRRLRVSEESGLPPYVTDTVITVGTFDGVHRGHRDVVQRLVARSRTLKIPSVLVTFDPHPLELVNPVAAPPLLTTHDEKLEVLAETGIDYMAVV